MLNISPVSWEKDEGLISQLWTRLLKDWKDINGMKVDALDKLGLRILWYSACDFSHFIWIHLIWNWNKVYEVNYFYRLLFLLLWCVPSSNFLVLRLWWCFMILGFRDLWAEHSPPPSPSPTFPNEAGRKVSLHQKQRNLPKSSTLSDIPFHWESLRLRDFIAFYVLKIKYTPASRCEHDFPAKRRDPILASCGISKHVRLFYKWLLLSLKTVTLFWHRGETSIISHSLPTPPPPITFKVALVLYWPALLSNQ